MIYGREGRLRTRRALRVADPSKIEQGVEELLRCVSPIHNMARTTTQDVEIGGEAIPAGSLVLLLHASANRDEAAFADPHLLDLSRRPDRHVAFGGNGPYFCRSTAPLLLPGQAAGSGLAAPYR